MNQKTCPTCNTLLADEQKEITAAEDLCQYDVMQLGQHPWVLARNDFKEIYGTKFRRWDSDRFELTFTNFQERTVGREMHLDDLEIQDLMDRGIKVVRGLVQCN